jgi:4-diphosphocytidyl-2-C-methyl-D-erythritol kinase
MPAARDAMTRQPENAARGAAAVRVAAQAKVNLRLRILARETSGYHQIETLLLRLTLADVIRVRRAVTRTLDVTGDAAAIGPVDENLAWRAAVAYGEATGQRDGFAIELEKQIPIGGGLGGGSADAGAVLRALDAMAANPIGEPALLRIASSLGADVPFLTSEHAYALAWGRGDRLLALEPPPPRVVMLMLPSFPVNTAAAYGWLAAARAHAPPDADTGRVLRPGRLSDWDEISELATNDFEPVVAERHPAIGLMVRAMRDEMGLAPVMLAGSGSTVFGVAPGKAPAVGGGGTHVHDAQAEGSARPLRVVVTGTANRVEPVVALD